MELDMYFVGSGPHNSLNHSSIKEANQFVMCATSRTFELILFESFFFMSTIWNIQIAILGSFSSVDGAPGAGAA